MISRLLSRVTCTRWRGWNLRVERALNEGRLPVHPRPDRRSLVFFTTNKCASTFMVRAWGYLNVHHLGLTRADMARYLWNCTAAPVYEQLQERRHRIFRGSGFFCFP